MKEVHLQDDPGIAYTDAKDCKLVVSKYEIGDWNGDGEALVLGADDLVYYCGLGHCSCYGPFEHFRDSSGYSIEEFLALGEEVVTSWSDEVYARFKEELQLILAE